MATRFYNPGNDPRFVENVQVNTDINVDNAQLQAAREIIPKIAKKTRNAIQVTPVPFLYFSKLKVGRRCSCFSVETDPTAVCLVCFGTGIVGGYLKRGTKLVVMDVTHPGLVCVNTSPDYRRTTRPVHFALMDTAVYGYVETEIHFNTNIGKVDDIQVWASQKPQESQVTAYIRSPTETSFVLLTPEALSVRLGFSKLIVRVVMSRSNPSAHIPRLIGIRISYFVAASYVLNVDIPRWQESLTLEDFGVYQSFSSQTLALDNSIRNCSTEDFVYNIRDGLRWKVTEASDNRPLGILTSWDLTARLVQQFEPYFKVPIGTSPEVSEIPPRALLSYQAQAQKETKTELNTSSLSSLRSPDMSPEQAPNTLAFRKDPKET
jgi:hypothetical protein